MARKNIFLIFISVFFQMSAWAQEKVDKTYLDALPVDAAVLSDYESNPEKYLKEERLLRLFAVEYAKFIYVSFSKQIMTSMNLTEGPVPKEYLNLVLNYLKTQPVDVIYNQVKDSQIRFRLLTANYRTAALLNLTKQGFFQKYVPEVKIDTPLLEDYLTNPYRYWQPENISIARKYFVEIFNFYYANQVIGTIRKFNLPKSPAPPELYTRLRTEALSLTDKEISQALNANDNSLIYFDSQIKNELISRLLEILFEKLNITQTSAPMGEPQVLEEVHPTLKAQLKSPLTILWGLMFGLTWMGMIAIYLKGGNHR